LNETCYSHKDWHHFTTVLVRVIFIVGGRRLLTSSLDTPVIFKLEIVGILLPVHQHFFAISIVIICSFKFDVVCITVYNTGISWFLYLFIIILLIKQGIQKEVSRLFANWWQATFLIKLLNNLVNVYLFRHLSRIVIHELAIKYIRKCNFSIFNFLMTVLIDLRLIKWLLKMASLRLTKQLLMMHTLDHHGLLYDIRNKILIAILESTEINYQI